MSSLQAALLAAEDARVISSPQLLAAAAIVGTELGVIGDAEGNVARANLCEEALGAWLETPRGERALLGLVLSCWCEQRAGVRGGTRTEPRQRRAIQLCRRSGDTSTLVRPIFIYSQLLEWTPRIRNLMSLAQELIVLGRKDRDVRAEAYGYHIRALARPASGDREGFSADDRRIDDLLQRVANWYLEVFRDLWRGMLALLDGRFEDVEAAGQALTTRGKRSQYRERLFFPALLVATRARALR